MVLPNNVQAALEKVLEDLNLEDLKEASEALTQNYQTCGFLKEKKERIAYLATRLPATYESVHRVLEKIPFKVHSFLDLGSGPGTASFAALSLWGEEIEIQRIEKDPTFIELASQLGAKGGVVEQDLKEAPSLDEHDVVCFGYSWGEILDESVLAKAWLASKKGLVMVEPGTPKGYANILKARDFLIRLGAHLIAPCPHTKRCPLEGSDWCHFSVRVERSFLHRKLKSASLPYEDEKFSYLVATKEGFEPVGARILRDPLKKSGHVHLFLCCPDGEARHEIVSKRNKDAYKKARKANWGDLF